MANYEYRSSWDVYRFEAVTSSCESAGLSRRETAYVIAGGGHVAPLPDEIREFRRWQSFGGLPKSNKTMEHSVLKAGKAQCESRGELCSSHLRKSEFKTAGVGDFFHSWEGTAFWDEYQAWYTKVFLSWHPRYNYRYGSERWHEVNDPKPQEEIDFFNRLVDIFDRMQSC